MQYKQPTLAPRLCARSSPTPYRKLYDVFARDRKRLLDVRNLLRGRIGDEVMVTRSGTRLRAECVLSVNVLEGSNSGSDEELDALRIA